MEKTSTLVHNVYTNAKDYIHLKTRSLKLEAYDQLAGAASVAVNGAVIAVLGLSAFLFLNVGIAYALSDAFESTKLGFLTLGGIYVVLLGIFFAIKGNISIKIKNSAVVKMSKETVTDYEVMVREKHTVNAQLERAETLVVGNIEELKENVDTLVEDFKRLKEDVQRFRHLFGGGDHRDVRHDSDGGGEAEHNHHHNGSTIPKLAVNTIVELLINRFVLKDVNSLKKVFLPILAKAFLTTKMTKPSNGSTPEESGGGFFNTLKAKFSKFL